MIKSSEMLPLLVKACPSFAAKWESHRREYFDETDFLPYIALAEFGGHLIQLHDLGSVDELMSAFEVVDRLHVEGEHDVREAATIGLLEALQTQLGNKGRDPEVFKSYLLPVSAKWWDELNRFWNGEIKYVGETLNAQSVP